jgi:3-oxoacyl-(acyl-carrier-protein) synthase
MKVAITGLGVVSACGLNKKETLESFSSGKRSAGEVSLFKTELKYPVFEVKGLTFDDSKRMRTLNLAFHALNEALEDANLKDFSGLRVGICLGTTVASQLNDVDFYKSYRSDKSSKKEALERFFGGNLSCAVADFLGIKREFCATIVNACSSGTDAIGLGFSWINSGYCDIVIAGGADELSRIPFDGFGSLGVVSNSLCSPFDKNRNGLNLGEGAGIIIMENDTSLRKRGLKADLFVNGYGLAADAYHLTAPHPEGRGLEAAINFALFQSEIEPGQISFANAHGTATKENDKVEGAVLKKVFGGKAKFLSTKGFTGHTLGAAGGLEAAFTCLSLRMGWIPASIGFSVMDSEIGIAPVDKRTEVSGAYAISTSLAFGGNNSALIFSRN